MIYVNYDWGKNIKNPQLSINIKKGTLEQYQPV